MSNKVRIIVLIAIFMLLLSLSSSSRETGLSMYNIVSRGTVMATAYNSMIGQTDSTPWITASGTRCREGVVAANHLPIGTKILIEGYGDRIFVVEDKMNRRYSRRIDIWMKSYDQARRFGKREITYYVLKT